MRRFFSYLPPLASLAIFAALYASSQNASRLPYSVAVVGTIALAVSGTLCYQALWRGSSIAPGAMPALLVGGTSFAFFFIEFDFLRIAVAAATAILFLVLVRHLAESSKIESAAAELRALSEWSALVALVGLTAGLLGAMTFLNWNPWACTLVFAIVACYASFVLSHLGKVPGFFAPIAAAAVLTEGFVVIGMLPTSHWVGAGLVGAISYLMFSTLAAVPFSSIKRAIFSAAAICAVLLVTAGWR
jgi:hypothetical protein